MEKTEIKKVTTKYLVVVRYDCGLGDNGDVISRHRSYEAAEKAAKRTGFDDFLCIDIIDD